MHSRRAWRGRVPAVMLLVVGASVVASGAAGQAPAADFYVAVDGSDAAPGTRDKPFATLQRARDAIRVIKASRSNGPVRVLVRGGTYYLAGPLELGPEDSGTATQPILYAAAAGEEVTLSGGRPITGWTKRPDGLWTADVPGAKEGECYFRDLFVEGVRQIRARTPNFDPEHPTTGGWAFVVPLAEKGKPAGRFGDSLVRIHTPGDTFLWRVAVPQDGEYSLWLYYAAQNAPFGTTTMAGRTTMQVDDTAPVPLQNLPDTGSWETFKWSKAATLRLAKGEHRLRWTNVRSGGLNWDAYALSNDPAWIPAGTKLCDPAAGRAAVIVQAETFETGRAKESETARGPGSAFTDRFQFKPGDLRRWPQSPDPEIHIFPAWGWVNAILSVDRIDLDADRVYVKNRNCTQELRPGNRYFVENVFEALDAPGEWFLDRAQGRLYYLPLAADFAGKNVVAPVLDRLIDIAGEDPGGTEGEIYDRRASGPAGRKAEPRFAEHLVIRGFTFRHTAHSLEMGSVYTPDDGCIWLRRARDCVIENCRFLGVGGYAVRMSMRSRGNRVIRNEIAETGGGGVLLAGYETANQPHHNVIAGNHIHHCGRVWKHVAGVYVTTGSDNRIAHNTITDLPRYGVSLKSFRAGSVSHRNVVEFNRILRTNLETNDTGAIETLGRDGALSGNVIRGNLILDVVGLGTTETGRIVTPHFTWGIYLDDASSGTTVEGNIVARTVRGGIHVHLGHNNRIENNILVDGAEQQVEFNGDAAMKKNTFVRNIVVGHGGGLLRVSAWSKDVLAECDRNLYWRVGSDLAKAEGPLTPKGPWAAWQAAGYDPHSVIGDPLFVDPARDDYRLRPDSPALQLGFKPISVERIGPAGYPEPAPAAERRRP